VSPMSKVQKGKFVPKKLCPGPSGHSPINFSLSCSHVHVQVNFNPDASKSHCPIWAVRKRDQGKNPPKSSFAQIISPTRNWVNGIKSVFTDHFDLPNSVYPCDYHHKNSQFQEHSLISCSRIIRFATSKKENEAALFEKICHLLRDDQAERGKADANDDCELRMLVHQSR